MINGLGVLGWGVGGIEAEAAMLGPAALHGHAAGGRLQAHRHACARASPPPTWCSPSRRCCARRAWSRSSWSSTAPASPQMTPGRPRHHRQHGARVRRHLRLLPGRRRDARATCAAPAAAEAEVDLVERYCKEQGLFRTDGTPDPVFSDTLELDLATVEPSLAGPKRPQDRVPLAQMKDAVPQGAHGAREGPRLRPGRGRPRRARRRSR